MTSGHQAGRDSRGGAGEGESSLRRLLLLWLLLGTAGLAAELLLLEHTESLTQWIPFLVLGGALVAGVAVAVRPTRGGVLAVRACMGLAVAAGLLGLVLHYQGNAEFELERDATLGGLALVWQSLRGATPALAPGAMIQLGLLGLLFTHRHPALRRPAAAPDHPTPRGSS